MQPFSPFWSLFHLLFLTLIISWGHRPAIVDSHLPLMVAGFRSVCGEGSSEPPCLLDRAWNNACTFAKDISWEVCMCEEKEPTLVCFPVGNNRTFLLMHSLPWCVAHSVSSAGSGHQFQCQMRGKDWKLCLPSSPWQPLCPLSVQTQRHGP